MMRDARRFFGVMAVVLASIAGAAWGESPGSKPVASAEEAFRKAEAYGEKKNYREALRWYRVAADQGHAESQNDVGMFYISGMGVKKDYAEGMRWLRKAADQGSAIAERNIGFVYLQGMGVAPNRDEALRWLRKAAAKNDDEAKDALKALGAK